MFPIGSKVIVLASNTHSKSSPRVGSLGFISTNNGATEYYDDYLEIKKANITFYKFGFQKEYRIESKICNLIKPAYFDSEIKAELIVKNLLKQTFSVKSSTPSLVIAPANQCSFNYTDLNFEYKCYILSILNNPDFNDYINFFLNNAARPCIKSYIGTIPTLTSKIAQTLKSVYSASKKDLFPALDYLLKNDIDTIKGIITYINIIKQIIEKQDQEEVLKDINGKTHLAPSHLLYSSMFKPSIFNKINGPAKNQVVEIKKILERKARELINKH